LGADDNYVTDAEKTVIGNTSGTNTGDNATNTQYSGLVSNATHTGDVTGDTALTIANNAVTNANISGTGTRSASTYYNGAGNFSTPTNTTYTEISQAEITAGTASTTRSLSGRRAEFIVTKARDGRVPSTDGAKLDLIEAQADVTDATNVDAAGATMNTDTDVSGNAYVLDEDTMTSDSATKIPTQQSVKKYVDDARDVNYTDGAFRYYVKGTTGSDSNDGLTAGTAFQTVEKALSFYNKGRVDLRMYLAEAGTYTLEGTNFVGGSALHLSSTVSGVTLNLDVNASSFAFYNVHLNISGVDTSNRLTLSGDTFHLDNSDLVAQFTNFNTDFNSYGSTIRFESCGFKEIYAINSSVYSLATNVINTDPTRVPVYLNNSMWHSLGTWTVSNLTATGTKPFFEAHGSRIAMGSGFLNSIANKYTYAWELHETEIIMSAARYLTGADIAVSRIDNDEGRVTTGPIDGVSGVSYGSGYSATSISLSKIGSICTLSGYFAKSSDVGSGDTILTIPAGWRPFETQYVGATSTVGGKTSRVDISTSGVVSTRNGSTSMSNVIFSITYFVGG